MSLVNVVFWGATVLFAAISIVLLFGKGSFLIAGYNTASAEKKAKFNAKRLCRVVGGGLSVLTVFMALNAIYEAELPYALSWIFPYGYLGTIAAIAILANTICHAKT